MKTTITIAALCLALFAVVPAASAADFNADSLKDCLKGSGSSKCDLGKFSKAFEDISKGKKPNVDLPFNPKSLPIGDLAKFLK
jgi:hypothetical protein